MNTTHDDEKAAYYVSAGIDYNAGRAGIYEFTIFGAPNEVLVHRGSGYRSKKAAVNAAVKWAREQAAA